MGRDCSEMMRLLGLHGGLQLVRMANSRSKGLSVRGDLSSFRKHRVQIEVAVIGDMCRL